MKETDPKRLIRERALALGFDAIGFCQAELGVEARERLAAFLEAVSTATWAGSHRAPGAQRSGSLWPDARSVIALGLSYAPEHDPLADARAWPTAAPSRSMPATATTTTSSRAC